jgi:hypothetical protein
MAHCTWLVCLTCRTGLPLGEVNRSGHREVACGYDIERFSLQHVSLSHDTRILDSEVARMVVGDPLLPALDATPVA